MTYKYFDLRPLAIFCVAIGAASSANAEQVPSSFAGTWTLAGTNVIHKDGSEVPDPDYGSSPKGLMMIDQVGHYSTQIFKENRPRFASGDKTKATATEYRDAIVGASTHFGTLLVDPEKHTLTFEIKNSSFPNWEGQKQVRSYTLKDNQIRYSVPPRPNGDTPVTIWQRLN
ncbi:lipocalin-like domain-containing protein [Brucella intermedia]|uniref:lipocalin-like domain-containing protein n=1 Tax=Brucella intermedia TaxID=94625 RepID=UPI00224B8397|nr:lipocalin-like domain-containing protein [Brucella intermedia]